MTLFVKQCLLLCIFIFSSNNRLFNISRIFSEQYGALIFPDFLSFSSQTLFQSTQPAFSKLTFLHSKGIRNLNALAYLGKKWYLCIEMSGKGSISRMSDECLITLETVFSFYTQYQAVMRKFTLAGKSRYRDMCGVHL